MQIANEIIHKLEEFIHIEQGFSQDYYISATEPLMQLEELLTYLRLLPRPELVERIEKERSQLFHWAHIGNGEKSNDAKTICEARGKTKGSAKLLADVLKEGLAAEKERNTTCTKIKYMFWKLYEITLKAFFDSLLGKWRA